MIASMRTLKILVGILGGLALGLAGAMLGLLIASGQFLGSSPEELREDLDMLFDTIETVHPAPYTHTSFEELQQRRDAVEAQLTESLDSVEFYRLAAPLVAALGDGHTSISPPSSAYSASTWLGDEVFPLELEFEGERALVRRAPVDSDVPEGAELLRINGRPARERLAGPLSLVSGERMVWRRAYLTSRLPQFWWLAHGEVEELRCELRSPKGETLIREIEGVHMLGTLGAEMRRAQPFGIELLEDRGALLTVGSFENGLGFESFIRQSFQKIRDAGVRWLIIDLRENWGGNSALGDELLQYLTDRPFRQYSRIRLKVSPQIRPRYPGHIPDHVSDGEIHDFEVPLIQPRAEPLRFSGKLYVLIGPRVFSSGTAFASAIKDLGLGTLVGEETGGAASCFGDLYSFELPSSGLTANCSHKWFFRPSGENDGHGVRPDIEAMASRALGAAMEAATTAPPAPTRMKAGPPESTD